MECNTVASCDEHDTFVVMKTQETGFQFSDLKVLYWMKNLKILVLIM